MIIDCDSCEVRGLACGDCVVTALLGAPPTGLELDEGERVAFDVLASSGLVPPLRLVVAVDEVLPGPAVEDVDHRAANAPDVSNVAVPPEPDADGRGRSVAAG